jgi:hypothetical protein
MVGVMEVMSMMRMGANGRKGVFFSMILICIVIFLFMFIALQGSMTYHYSSQKSVENRINAMMSFYSSVVTDSQKSMGIVAKRAASSSINYVVTNNLPLASANDSIAQAMMNGQVNGQYQALMTGSTVGDWQSTVENLGTTQGFGTNVEVMNLTVLPYDSYHLIVSYKVLVNLSDTVTPTNISKSSGSSFILPIENFEDPMYPLNTYARIVSVYRRSPHWPSYSSTNLYNLSDDMNHSYYHPSLTGPSFLDRLEGKFYVQTKYLQVVGNGTIGLESLVNKDTILGAGLWINASQTSIDYLYFSANNSRSFSIIGMPASFKLDNETTINGQRHLSAYNVTVV